MEAYTLISATGQEYRLQIMSPLLLAITQVLEAHKYLRAQRIENQSQSKLRLKTSHVIFWRLYMTGSLAANNSIDPTIAVSTLP